MGIDIGVISVRGADYHPTRRLAEAAAERGHRLFVIHPYRLWPGCGRDGLFTLNPGRAAPPDVVLPRQGADVGTSCLALVSQFQSLGIRVINGFDAIRISRHQFYTLQRLSAAGVPVPPTVFVNESAGIDPAAETLGGYPLVIKTVSGRQGGGVFLAASAGEAAAIAAQHLNPRRGLLVQHFFHPEGRSDIRVLVIGETVAGGMQLMPVAGDFRSNYHLTGNSRPVAVSAAIKRLALAAAGALGLDIAGVDLILTADGTARVIEVNYSPGFKGLESATGRDIAGAIIEYAASQARQPGAGKRFQLWTGQGEF